MLQECQNDLNKIQNDKYDVLFYADYALVLHVQALRYTDIFSYGIGNEWDDGSRGFIESGCTAEEVEEIPKAT